jgi:hypothetical protein
MLILGAYCFNVCNEAENNQSIMTTGITQPMIRIAVLFGGTSKSLLIFCVLNISSLTPNEMRAAHYGYDPYFPVLL